MVHLTTALDASSGVPLYEQLYRSLAGEMRSGTLAAGTRMPGKRRLAAELSVSVNTVDAAYQMLAAEGYLESRERSGFYVQEYLALPSRPAGGPEQPAPPKPEPPVLPVRSASGLLNGVQAPVTNGSVMSITQTNQRAIIDWQSFNIGLGSTVNVAQPGATSILVNRVVAGSVSAGPSTINGSRSNCVISQSR